jgi:prophage tail gpP-like protein
MPNPTEICVVTALGQRYDTWETVEVHRSTDDVIDHAMLTVAEITSPSATWAALKLKPGDQAQVSLAGKQVLNGKVYLRQAAIDPNSHAVQIGIASKAQPIIPASVEAKPGTYKKQTIESIGKAVFGKYGIGFKVAGSPAGANLPFPRVSERVGETCFGFIERLCRLRNLHLIDDGQGGIEAYRGPQGTTAPLQEGRNILRARILLRNDEHVEDLQGVGQNARQSSADASRDIAAQTMIPGVFGATGMTPRLLKFIVEDATDTSSAQMRVNHEANMVAYNDVDGAVTVPGWLREDGSLWFDHVRDKVVVNSPSLIPGDSMTFFIKGVIHRQNSADGTTTDVLLCREDGKGAGGEVLRDSGTYPPAPAAEPGASDHQ